MEWISVEKRLPELGERVLLSDRFAVFEAYRCLMHEHERGWAWMRFRNCVCVIDGTATHWAELPNPPEVKQ